MRKKRVFFIGIGGIGVSSLAQYYMATGWKVAGSDAVKSEITDDLKKNIRRAIELKLTANPEVYGKPLRGSLRNYRKLRVWDYRIIFRIGGSFVKILVIKHRSEVYSVVEKRLRRG